jgi:hypothetical protein
MFPYVSPSAPAKKFSPENSRIGVMIQDLQIRIGVIFSARSNDYDLGAIVHN